MKKDITHKRDEAIFPPIDDPILSAFYGDMTGLATKFSEELSIKVLR